MIVTGMQYVQIGKEHIHVHVNLDILEMEQIHVMAIVPLIMEDVIPEPLVLIPIMFVFVALALRALMAIANKGANVCLF